MTGDSYPKRALVVDDDSGTRNLFRLVLKPLGYDVRMAADGRDALAAIAEQSYELIITDLHLPDTTGLALAERARGANPHSHIVMATIDDDDETMLRAFTAGCNVYLIKPYNLEHVVQLLRRLEGTGTPVRLLSDRLGVHEYH